MDDEQMDPLVPSSDRPRKSEWTDKFWYCIFTYVMQAKGDDTDENAVARVALLTNLHAGLPCAKCKDHFKANLAIDPYTLAMARNERAGCEWVLRLRARIQRQLDWETAEKEAAAATDEPHYTGLACVPLPPSEVFAGITGGHNHSEAALARQLAAIEASFAKTARLRSAGADCGCSLKPRAFSAPRVPVRPSR